MANTVYSADSNGFANIVADTTPQLGGNLDVNGNIITASTATVSITGSTSNTGGQATQTGIVYVVGTDATSDQSGTVYINGVSGGSTNPADVGNVYVNVGGNNTQPYGKTYIGSTNGLAGQSYDNEVNIRGLEWPSADGTAGQVMTTDGAGNLSFAELSYTADSAGLWSAPVPTTVDSAIDRLALLVKTLNGGVGA